MGLVICDKEYPARVCFTFLNKVVDGWWMVVKCGAMVVECGERMVDGGERMVDGGERMVE